jgi:hypothetical protein
MRTKNPIERIDDKGGVEKLIEARAFIPRDCVVAAIVGRKPDGSSAEYHVHSVQHVFARPE